MDNTSLHLHSYIYKAEVTENLQPDLFDASNNSLSFIEPLSKINIFVGPNNSGKSLLLRDILKQEMKSVYFSKETVKEINKITQLGLENVKAIFKEHDAIQFASNNRTFKDNEIGYLFMEINKIVTFNEVFNKIYESISLYTSSDYHTSSTSYNSSRSIIGNNLTIRLRNIFENTLKDLSKYQLNHKLNRLYIPTIRTLRIYGNSGQFSTKTSNEYNLDSKVPSDKYFISGVIIENGENFYGSIFKLKNSTPAGNKKVREFEDFLRDNFFNNKEVELVTNEDEKVLYIKIGEEIGQPIHHLGDGLQMLIILTFPLFSYDYGMIVIEEPEVFIHPGLQRRLIDIYSNHPRSSNFIFFISTHSNHIVDCINYSESISLFSVNKFYKTGDDDTHPSFIVRNLSYGDENIINSLGITNTSVFMSNCTIWVEGVTDRMYIKKFIDCYLSDPTLKSKYIPCRKFQEGINYSFIFSAGDNIIHYDFNDEPYIEQISEKPTVKYLCGKSLVIIDDDDNKNKARKLKLERELGLNFIILPVIEIESILSYETIVNTIKSFHSWRDLDISTLPSYGENEYSKIRLGAFIDKSILKDQSLKARKKFSVDSSTDNLTINCKVQFCEYALKHITHANMSKSSIKLVERILDFMLENNRTSMTI